MPHLCALSTDVTHYDTVIDRLYLSRCSLQRRYVGTDGIYTHTAAYEQDPLCAICSPGLPFEVQSSMTLQQVLPKACVLTVIRALEQYQLSHCFVPTLMLCQPVGHGMGPAFCSAVQLQLT